MALAEDIGPGDVTSQALVPPDYPVRAVIEARCRCVLAGMAVAAEVFRQVDRALVFRAAMRDGDEAGVRQVVAVLEGSARSILAGERTALNFLQRLSGIATLTREFVRKVEPWRTRILDTRKTTPGMRMLEKHAVHCGGGVNHRIGLYDKVLIKDNHRMLWSGKGSMRLDEAVRQARRAFPKLEIEIEVEDVTALRNALEAKPDWVLLDNMSPMEAAACVRICRGRTKVEASGGITLVNVESYAAAGVHAISLGCLTHSAPAADLSLEFEKRDTGCGIRDAG